VRAVLCCKCCGPQWPLTHVCVDLRTLVAGSYASKLQLDPKFHHDSYCTAAQGEVHVMNALAGRTTSFRRDFLRVLKICAQLCPTWGLSLRISQKKQRYWRLGVVCPAWDPRASLQGTLT
jgi:hypothetical protein